MNTSASGGFLAPDASPAPLDGKPLLVLLQSVIAGVTGLPGSMVRVRWQAEPPNPPKAGTAWCSVGVARGDADTFSFIKHRDTVDGGADDFQRQEELELLCSFYDLGVEGEADGLADRLRDGLQIAQNRETLQMNKIDVAYTGKAQIAPVLNKARWQYRVDLPVVLRRQINRTYLVRNLASAQVHLVAEDAARVVIDETITVTP